MAVWLIHEEQLYFVKIHRLSALPVRFRWLNGTWTCCDFLSFAFLSLKFHAPCEWFSCSIWSHCTPSWNADDWEQTLNLFMLPQLLRDYLVSSWSLSWVAACLQLSTLQDAFRFTLSFLFSIWPIEITYVLCCLCPCWSYFSFGNGCELITQFFQLKVYFPSVLAACVVRWLAVLVAEGAAVSVIR